MMRHASDSDLCLTLHRDKSMNGDAYANSSNKRSDYDSAEKERATGD